MSVTGTRKERTESRLHPLIRVLGYFLALAIINRVAFAGVAALLPSISAWLLALLEGGVYLAGVLVLTWAFRRFLDRQLLVSLGLQRRGWLSNLASGVVLGAGLIVLVFFVMAAAGWLAVQVSWPPALLFLASALSWSALSFVEELTFRGYIMQNLVKAWGMPVAVVVSSLMFGLVHLIDPNVQVLAVLNVCVAGLFFALAYLVSKSLWLPVGLHIGWNLTEIHILGFPGSGHIEPSILHSTVSGPALLTGGVFGPEGGLLGLGTTLLGITLLLILPRVLRRR